jgi:VID27 N-terminal region
MYKFKDAAASIQRATTKFNYHLVIQRAYEEEDEQRDPSYDGDLSSGWYISLQTRFSRLS